MGIAFSDYHDTLSAGVAEISLDQTSGKIKVHNYWIAVDPGLVIQPDHVHAQLESAVIYGLSAALYRAVCGQKWRHPGQTSTASLSFE
jgi:isoquinoline 1-oxidoreductase beta subunit